MSEVNTLLWQAEIFLSMSRKVVDPSLAAALQNTAETYLTRATEVQQRHVRESVPVRGNMPAAAAA
jgi:hypothetical protein